MSTRYIKREIEKHGYLVKNVKSIELMSNSSGEQNLSNKINALLFWDVGKISYEQIIY